MAITVASFSPENPAWDHAFRRLKEWDRVVFTAALDGSAYARHGTTVETRLTVIDRLPPDLDADAWCRAGPHPTLRRCSAVSIGTCPSGPTLRIGGLPLRRLAEAWSAEVATLPELVKSRFHIVTGLLLPIWRRLPQGGCRVYRLQTDDGERLIRRRLSDQWVAVAVVDAWEAVIARGATLLLEADMTVRRSLVMGLKRAELTGFTGGMVEQLKVLGLPSEIIAWRLRLFMPIGAAGLALLAALLERHSLQPFVDRAAA